VIKLDKDRRIVAEQVKRFEQAARDIQALADKLHKKMQVMHLETVAVRERARAARESAEGQIKKRGLASGETSGHARPAARKIQRPEKGEE